jgi:tetratricopeptide (TPR) repeat protein
VHPQDRTARFRLAQLHFQNRDYTRALAELGVIEKQRPRDPEVPLRKAVVLKYAGNLNAAEQADRRALALQPSYGLAEELLGEILMDQRRYEDALKVFERRLQREPKATGALLGKGRALEQLLSIGHPITAAQIVAPIEKASAQVPNDAQVVTTLARVNLAYLHSEKGLSEAERYALRAAELNPQDAQPYIILGQVYLARPPTPTNLEKLGYYAAQAGTLDLKDPRPPYLIGRVALFQNDAARAIRALELSLSLGPLPETVTQLAVAYRRAGNRAQADHYARIYQEYARRLARRDALLAAREREPREVRHYHDLAQLYLEAGQPNSAAAWLEQARTVRPRDEARDALIARVQELRNQGTHAPLLPIP